MQLKINGTIKDFQDKTSLENIIIELKILDKVMACAVNMDIIKKDNWKNYYPKDKDSIELLEFVGGG